MGKAQAKVAAHNWINYDFGPGPHSRIGDLVRFPLGEQLYIPPTWREVQFFASTCPRNSETPNRERTRAADGWGVAESDSQIPLAPVTRPQPAL